MRIVVPNLMPGSRYALQFRSKNATEASLWSRTFLVDAGADTTPPSMPTGVSVSVSGDSFMVDWNPVTTSADGSSIVDFSHYLVKIRNVDTGDIATMRADDHQYELTYNLNVALFTPIAGTVGVSVAAVDTTGNVSTYSTEIVRQNPPPGPVKSLTAVSGIENITSNWEKPDNLEDDFLEYRLFITTDSNAVITNSSEPAWAGQGTSYVYATGTAVPLYVKVVAVDKFNSISTVSTAGPVTARSGAEVDITPPATPTNLAGTITGNQLKVTFTAPPNPDNDLAGYQIGYRKAGGSEWSYTTASHEDTSIVITPIELYKNYETRIRAHDFSFNYSGWSTTVTVNGATNTAPAVPTGLQVKGAVTSAMVLWNANTEPDLAGYEVQFKTTSSFSEADPVFSASGRLITFSENVSTDTNYYARVRAVDTEGLKSAWSAVAGGVMGQDKADSAITEYVVQYSVNTSETVPPTGGWSDSTPTRTPGSYIWYRTLITYGNGTTTTSNPALLTGNDGATGAPGADGADAYTVLLSNESHDFPGGTTAAIAGSTTSDVIAFQGTTAKNATIGTITGQVTGLTTAITNNGTTAPRVTITVTTSLTARNGILVIPVTVDGQTFTKNLSWSVNRTGATGAAGPSISLAATTQVLTVDASGAISPATSVVTGTVSGTTISTWTYSVNGGAFTSTKPAYVSTPSGNSVTVTGSTMTDRTVAIKATGAITTATDTVTIAKVVDGATGSPGIPGTPGADGTTYYTWLKYANSATPAAGDMSDSPVGKTYMGLAVNKTSATETTNYADYTWSLIQGPQGNQGIPGNPGADGTTTYTWVKYGDSPTTGMSDTPTGKAYIGLAFNKTTATESSTYGDYQWSLIQGPQGNQGIPGTPGSDGITYYTWLKYASSATPSAADMSDSPTGKTYMGIGVNKTTATETTNYNDYVWSLIQGPQGNQGIPGTPGADGTTTYTWVKYAPNGAPSDGQISDTPTGMTHIGFAFNKTTATESTSASQYQWSLFQGPQGNQGIPGSPGADGVTYYTWLKYATSATPAAGDMSDSPVGKTYMGIGINKTTQTESTNYNDYTWSLIQGADGASAYTVLLSNESHDFPGGTSAAIAGSTTSDVMAYQGTTQMVATVGTITGQVTGLTTAITNNGTTAPRITITVTTSLTARNGILSIPITVDGQTFTKNLSWSVNRTGATGAAGPAVSLTASTQVFAVDAGGAINPATSVVTGTVSGTTISTWTYSVNGGAFTSTKPAYVSTPSGNAVTVTASTMTDRTVAIKATGAITTASDTVTIAKVSDGATGNQGIPGTPGSDGTTTYTWVKYADTTTTGMSDLPTGKAYIGLAFNKTTATESTSYGDYQWSKVTGEDGAPGSPGADGVSITSVTPFFMLVTKGAAAPTQPSGTGNPSGWSTTEPAFVANRDLYRTERVLYSNSTASWTPVTKVSAYTGIDEVNTIAITADKRVRKSNASPVLADGTGAPVGALWYVYGAATSPATGTVLKETWEWTGSAWQARGIDRTFLPAVDIATGTFGDFSGDRLVANSVGAGKIKTAELAADSAFITALYVDAGHVNNLTFDKLSGGLGIINDLTVKSTMTLGDASTNGVIQSYGYNSSTGVKIDKSGIIVNSGSISAAALNIQYGQNMMPAAFADFEFTPNFYTSNMYSQLMIVGVSTGGAPFGNQHIGTIWGTQVANPQLFFGKTATDYNIPVEAGKKYIVSAYVAVAGAVATALQLRVKWSNGTTTQAAALTPTTGSSTFVRMSGVVTAPAGVTKAMVYIESPTRTNQAGFAVDAVQFEEQMGALTTPSAWTPPSSTSIDGGMLRTGELRSNQTITVNGTAQPMWSIDMEGGMQISSATVRGNLVVGASSDGAQSYVQSYNYVPYISSVSPGTGWKIRSDGYAEFNNVKVGANTIGLEEIKGGVLTVDNLEAGTLTVDMDIAAGGKITTGSSWGTGGELTDSGLTFYRQTEGLNREPVTYLGSAGDQSLMLTGTYNSVDVTSGFDSTGALSARTGSFNEDVTIAGIPLLGKKSDPNSDPGWIDNIPVPVAWGDLKDANPTGPVLSGPGVAMVGYIMVPVKANRRYRFSMIFGISPVSYASGARLGTHFKYAFYADGATIPSTPVTTSSATMAESINHITSSQPIYGTLSTNWVAPGDGVVAVGATINPVGCGAQLHRGATEGWRIYADDVGAFDLPDIAVAAAAPPKRTYTSIWTPSSMRSYQGYNYQSWGSWNGVNQVNKINQGAWSSGITNRWGTMAFTGANSTGSETGISITSALSGATINSVKIRLSSYAMSAPARIGWQSSFAPLPVVRQTTATIPEGGTVTTNMSSALATYLKASTGNRYITVGDDGTGNRTGWYAFYHGMSGGSSKEMQLIITYTK